MDHLEPGLIHLVIRIKIRVRRKPRLFRQCDDLWMGESAAVGILDNVDLELPYTTVQLRSERCVAILKGLVFSRIVGTGKFFLTRRKPEVVAVMRANYLDLIQVNPGVLIGHRLCRQHSCTTEDEQHGEAQTFLQSKLLFACNQMVRRNGRRGCIVVPRLDSHTILKQKLRCELKLPRREGCRDSSK